LHLLIHIPGRFTRLVTSSQSFSGWCRTHPLPKIKHSKEKRVFGFASPNIQKENWWFGFASPNPHIHTYCNNPPYPRKMWCSSFATKPFRFPPEGSNFVSRSASLRLLASHIMSIDIRSHPLIPCSTSVGNALLRLLASHIMSIHHSSFAAPQ
jgi:hypothetical protein